MGDKQKSDYYRNPDHSMFPESNYAQYLVNPNYFIEMEARLDTLNRYYQETFQHYRSGRYRVWYLLANTAMKNMKPDSTLLSKIEFMDAVAQGTQAKVYTILKTF